MADEFSFLTDSDDERAVEDVLSQAIDHSVLEQLAAINCSSFSTTDLPSHLETRFRKLKSLPATASSRFPPSKSKSLRPRSGDDLNVDERHPGFCGSVDFEQIPDGKKGLGSSPTDSPEEHSDGNRDEEKGMKTKSESESESESELKSNLKLKSTSNMNSRSEVFKQKGFKSKSGTGSSDSWSLSSPESDTGSLSPPGRKIGCLWCSPKKEKRKQGKENRLSSSSSWGNDAEFLKTFSMKEQKKIMKKAMKEEEKINREAEKIVKWAKQASARMMDDELGDLENSK